MRERMQRTSISDGMDILQIHWQDYSSPQAYLDLFRQLLELRNTRRIRIDVLGLVNFDTKRVNEICEAMGPGEILTNQIQVRTYLQLNFLCIASLCSGHLVFFSSFLFVLFSFFLSWWCVLAALFLGEVFHFLAANRGDF